ncbi:MAG: UvrD-helicase domain-containing protein [Rhodothermia bacterium]|nr:UvrD-helicase domain-containing protein [Rhodothermia bacterium]
MKPQADAAPTDLPDEAERRVIEEELGINLVVVASAGTGKTEALIRRMVAGVVSGTVEIDSLVAITFTRMAAGEMRARFAEKLREKAAESIRAAEALRRIDRCFIGTIHAFCARLLRERPLEAGLRPDFTEVDEHEVTVLWRHFWRDAIQELYASGDTRIDELRRLGVDVGELYDFFVTRTENSDLPLRPGLDSEPDLQPALQDVLEQIQEVRSRLGGSIPPERDTFLDQIDRAEYYRRNRSFEDAANKAELLRIYQRALKKSSVTLKKWPDEELARHVRDVLAPNLLENIVDPALTRWRQYLHGKVVPLIEDIVEDFSAYRRDKGLVTFHDLLLYTARLLRNRTDVRQLFQTKFGAFYVDEFQDTDPLQAEIIMYLASSGDAADWRDLLPEPGRLFIVGDEKQSIYRFRRADIDVFRAVTDRILESGGRKDRLKTSFRSLPPLCEWINSAFSKLFEEHDREYQADYDGLLPFRSEAADGPCVQRLDIPKVNRNRRDAIADKEAVSIANYILAMTRSDRSPGDFMILTRKRTHLDLYARELEKRAVPYDIIGGDSLSGSEELRSLVQMLEVIRRPADEVAMLGYLRGPLVGLGDDELYQLRLAGGGFRIWRLVPDGLPEELAGKLEGAKAQLDRARDNLMSLSPAAAISSIIEWTGLVAFSAGLEGGATRAGNLFRIISLVRGWEEQGMNWSQVVAELGEVLRDSKYQYEQMTLDVGRSDVVRIMNLHQAKGLQAPVVILADCYDTSRPDPNQHVSREHGHEYLSIPISADRGGRFTEVVAEPVGWAEDLERERLYSDAEELRNVYVAATRARDHLIVSTYPSGKGQGPWSRLLPALHSLPGLAAIESAGSPPTPEEMDDVGAAVDRIREQWQKVSEPTYAVVTATGEDPATGVEEFPAGERGADYGSVIHEVFQALIEERVTDIESFARVEARKAGISVDHIKQLVEEIEALKSSALFRELKSASEVYSEVPFSYRDDDEAVIRRGTIDLVYRSASGWAIVDFKSHRADTDEKVETLKRRYERQLASYRTAWEIITGEEVHSASLWLTGSGESVTIND